MKREVPRNKGTTEYDAIEYLLEQVAVLEGALRRVADGAKNPVTVARRALTSAGLNPKHVLNKGVCKRCRSDSEKQLRGGNREWGEQVNLGYWRNDDEAWRRGVVWCPSWPDSGAGFLAEARTDKVPEWCPYAAEHTASKTKPKRRPGRPSPLTPEFIAEHQFDVNVEYWDFDWSINRIAQRLRVSPKTVKALLWTKVEFDAESKRRYPDDS